MIPDSGFGDRAFKSPHTHNKYANSETDATRKSIHILNGLWAILLPFIPRLLAIILVCFAFTFVFVLSRPRSFFGKYFQKTFELMARKEDWQRGYLFGPSIYVLMVLFCLIFLDYRIAGALFVILAFGDGFATLIGKNFGKMKIHNSKSVEGFISFVIASFPTSFLIFQMINFFNTPTGGLNIEFTLLLPVNVGLIGLEIVILIFFIVNLFLAFVELYLGDYINDNILIPIIGAILFYLFFNLVSFVN